MPAILAIKKIINSSLNQLMKPFSICIEKEKTSILNTYYFQTGGSFFVYL
jgi:hypothetical protein